MNKHRYRSAAVVEAWRCEIENLNDAPRWVRDLVNDQSLMPRDVDDGVTLTLAEGPNFKGQSMARPCWIVQHEDESVDLVSGDLFEQTYRAIPRCKHGEEPNCCEKDGCEHTPTE